jgi:hypothetical protein
MKNNKLKVAFMINNSLYMGFIDGYVKSGDILEAVVVSRSKEKIVFRSVPTADLKVLSEDEYEEISKLSNEL